MCGITREQHAPGAPRLRQQPAGVPDQRPVDYNQTHYSLSTATVAACNSFTAVLNANLAHEYPEWLAAPVWAWLKQFSLP